MEPARWLPVFLQAFGLQEDGDLEVEEEVWSRYIGGGEAVGEGVSIIIMLSLKRYLEALLIISVLSEFGDCWFLVIVVESLSEFLKLAVTSIAVWLSFLESLVLTSSPDPLLYMAFQAATPTVKKLRKQIK